MSDRCLRALVVEDDDDIRDVVAMLLTVLGFEVQEAENGQNALDQIRDGWKPDIIVLDLMMPVMNGWTFRSELRKLESMAAVPVIVLSARRPPWRESDESFQVAEILPKPFELDTFLAAVSRHCPAAVARRPSWLGGDLDRTDSSGEPTQSEGMLAR